MHGGDRPRQTGDRIGTLLDALGAGGAVARERAEDLVREVIRDYSTDDEVITNAANDAGDAYAGEYGWAQNIIESER